jgi:tripartite-type tricarboxylate transporter receptor subunit TctC
MVFARLLAMLLLLGAPAAAIADPVEDFYRGKTLTLYIGYDVGGGYDFYGREVAKFFGRHLPGNPTVLPLNKPGASTMVLGNYLARQAPRDGTSFGIVNSALIFDPLFAGAASKAEFKGPDMTMIGNAVSAAAILLATRQSGVTSFEDLQTHPLVIGAMTRSGDTYVLPWAVKKVLGLNNLKLITGYPGTREVAIAMEQGEVSGRVWDMEGMKAARPQWLTDGSVTILAQLAPKKAHEVPAQVPLVKDYIKSADDKRVLDVIFTSTILARPFIAPPDLPPDRVKALRESFMATLRDPEFAAEMARAQIGIDPLSGAEMQRMVADSYALPPALIQRVRDALAD